MLAKLTSKNQLTLPKAIAEAVGPSEYFDVQARDGQIILTPVRIQRGDAVRAKLAELALAEGDIDAAVAWARRTPVSAVRAAEPGATYATRPAGARPTAKRAAAGKARRKA